MKLMKTCFLIYFLFISFAEISFAADIFSSELVEKTDEAQCRKTCLVESSQYQQSCGNAYYDYALETYKDIDALVTCLSSVRIRLNACQVGCSNYSKPVLFSKFITLRNL